MIEKMSFVYFYFKMKLYSKIVDQIKEKSSYVIGYPDLKSSHLRSIMSKNMTDRKYPDGI